jgi:hypothetical protein
MSCRLQLKWNYASSSESMCVSDRLGVDFGL